MRVEVGVSDAVGSTNVGVWVTLTGVFRLTGAVVGVAIDPTGSRLTQVLRLNSPFLVSTNGISDAFGSGSKI